MSPRTTKAKTPLTAAEAVYGAMSEREFQNKHVIPSLEDRGWKVFVFPIMKLTSAGWPDVTALHSDIPVQLSLELKTQRGRVKIEQARTLSSLRRVPGIYARVVRPGTWRSVLDWIDSGCPSCACRDRGCVACVIDEFGEES